MLGSLSRDDLLDALKRCAVVSGGNRRDVEVALISRGDELVVEAATPDAAVRSVVPLVAPGSGEAVVPLQVLERYVTSVAGLLELSVPDETTLVVASDTSRAQLHQLVGRAVAPPEGGGEQPRGSLSASDLLRLGRVAHAAATGDAQPVLSSVRFEDRHAVACDGYRLAATRLTGEVPDTLVPAALVRRIAGETAPVSFRASPAHVEFSTGATTYWSSPVAGEYFDWRRFVVEPARTPERLEVARQVTLDAVRTIESMGLGLRQQYGPRVVLEGLADFVRIRSNDEVGEVIAEVEGAMSVPALTFNATYLRQCLEHLEDDRVRARLEGPDRAVIIEEDDYVEVIMPVRG